ncbi:unnamed protein product [Zymoseptoria tritici ST99CH_1A5]|uniref:Uncharacterized protein n=2 Tax=Zymoseptoria tritici TaxID=1047171 RepID=A0A2H1H9Y2_ZYMTR|nr:unnamed protein product [Zymoseptoria tritici ST99CH_1E4]SMY30531.1 unnamed protein product [Zymoseptoria tritici ST99CH_1A5]
MDKNREQESSSCWRTKHFREVFPRDGPSPLCYHTSKRCLRFQRRFRAMMARKFTKVSLNSFNHRCVNWTMIEQARDETGEAGGSDVDMQDAVGEEDKGIRTSKHTAAAAAAADSSRHNAHILHDQTTDAFARQNHGK